MMSIKEVMASLISKMRQGPVIANNQEPNLPNGGHTGYVPPVTPQPGFGQKSTQPPAQPPQGPGFSGNGYDPNYYANTGFQQNYSGTSFQQAVPQQTGWQTNFRTAQQAMQGNPAFGGAQYTGTMGNQMGNPFAAGPQGASQTPQQGMGQMGPQMAPQMTGVQQNYPVEGNVVYPFGQQFRDEDGRTYNHCERLAQPISVATCFRLIEFMRNGESIIVNLELVLDEQERNRCLDMLFGAAFTMNCTFNRVAHMALYLIAPSTVVVKPYESIREMTQQDMDQRWGAKEGEQPSGQRSRRTTFGERRTGFGAF